MVIFNSYVKLPEGKSSNQVWLLISFINREDQELHTLCHISTPTVGAYRPILRPPHAPHIPPRNVAIGNPIWSEGVNGKIIYRWGKFGLPCLITVKHRFYWDVLFHLHSWECHQPSNCPETSQRVSPICWPYSGGGVFFFAQSIGFPPWLTLW